MASNELSRRRVLRLGAIGAGALGLGGTAIGKRSARDSFEEFRSHHKDRLKEFIALSEVLTGVTPLDRDLASQYLARFAANPVVGPFLQDLLDGYGSVTILKPGDQPSTVKSRIWNSPALRPAAEQLIYLWYISAFAFRDQANPTKIIWEYGTEEQYNRALVWKVIHGHPPMTTPSTWTTVPAHLKR